MAIWTLYLPSVLLYLRLHPLCLCHQTQVINYTKTTHYTSHTHTIHVTSYSVCMLSQQMFRTLHTSTYNFTPSIFMTSYPICMLSPYCFHDNTMTIPDISPAIFDITATVSVSSHRRHTHLYQCMALSVTSKQVCNWSHLAHVWHHSQSTSHYIHTIWYPWSCFMTSHTRHSWHQISSQWHPSTL